MGIHGVYGPISFLLLLLISIAAAAASSPAISLPKGIIGTVNGDENSCVYTLYVSTGSIWKSGTDSIISVELLGADGYGVRITDLESWGGQMGDGHDYFEGGNLDIFTGRGPCMPSPPCWMNLTSDGSGAHHGWYCNYVELTTTGAHIPCTQQLFTVEQWLATDASPHQLFAVRDNCPAPPRSDAAAGGGEILRRVVEHVM